MKFPVLIIPTFLIALGQNCNLNSGKEGYCREPDDCFGEFEGDCQSGLTCCENSEKSAEKCKKYGNYIYKTDFQDALLVRPHVSNISQCNAAATPLIVGGSRVKPKEFPHMVAIGFGDDIENALWYCGGSLISENFVLTAAHCTKDVEWGPAKFVRMGAVNVKDPDQSNHQDFLITEIIIHPKYQPPSRYNDIALCRLSGSVEINEFVRPACLYDKPDEFNLQKATATGWGKLHYEALDVSQDLMKVELHFINYSTCEIFYPPDSQERILRRGVIHSQLCAGELQGGKDTCYGDSGGPIQVLLDEPYCTYSIVGITSFGVLCGFEYSPGIYTRVSYFVPWIESIVWL